MGSEPQSVGNGEVTQTDEIPRAEQVSDEVSRTDYWIELPLHTLIGRSGRFLVRRLYTHNPFYLISAVLVLCGLNRAFGMSRAATDCWLLLWTLAGYTALLAAVAVMIVRVARVWQDARTVVLLVLMLPPALSVSFDEILVRDFEAGTGPLLIGLGFGIALTEALLPALRIRLRRGYRASIYLLMALYFLYPLFLRHLLKTYEPEEDRGALALAVYGFAVAGAVCSLSLLPAIRRGRAYASGNGTPWRWPWFPWCALVPLLLGLVVRTYSLTLSFFPAYGMASPFDGYFLAPLLIAWGVLLVEMALKERNRWLLRVGVLMPLVALVLAFPHSALSSRCYREYLQLFLAMAGSPVFLAAVGCMLFYVYAVLRRVPGGWFGLAVSLGALSVISPETVGLGSLRFPPNFVPFGMMVGIAIRHAWRRSRTLGAVLTSAGGLGAASILLRGTWFTPGGLLPVTLSLLAMMIIGALWLDRFAFRLQRLVPYAFTTAFVFYLFAGHLVVPALPQWTWSLWHAQMLLILALYYWRWARYRSYLRALMLTGGLFVLQQTWLFYQDGAAGRIEGGHQMFWGLVCLAVGITITLCKAGLLQRLWHRMALTSPASADWHPR